MPPGADTEALRDHLFDLRKTGFNRLYQGGQVFEFSTPESLARYRFLEARLHPGRSASRSIPADARQRIVDTTEIAYREVGRGDFRTADRRPSAALQRKVRLQDVRPHLRRARTDSVQFQLARRRLPRCQGFGNTVDYDMDLVIPDRICRSIKGAVDPWTKPQYTWGWTDFRKDAKGKGAPRMSLHRVERSRKGASSGAASASSSPKWRRKKYKVHVRVFISRYRGYAECPDCGGSRLRKEALKVRVGGGPWPKRRRLRSRQDEHRPGQDCATPWN